MTKRCCDKDKCKHELPYVFDLLWDIKTLERLQFEYNAALQKAKDLKEMADTYDITLEVTEE